jgi:transposase-like protein
MSEEECYKQLRELRWPDEVICPHCRSTDCAEIGRASKNKATMRYRCHSCDTNFNDLTKTIFQSSHVNLKHWMCCLYLMGLNVSNSQIAQELDINLRTVQDMCNKLRQKVLEERPEVQLSGEVELDEVYVVAGHKGHPEAVKKKGVRADQGD